MKLADSNPPCLAKDSLFNLMSKYRGLDGQNGRINT